MWRLLEARLLSRLAPLSAAAGCGVAGGLVYFGVTSDGSISPEEFALALGALTLLAVWLYQVVVFKSERSEDRLTLLAVLPVPMRRVALSWVLEPMVFPSLVVLLALVGGVLGRLAVGGQVERQPLAALCFGLSVALLLEQIQLLWDEAAVRKHRLALAFVWLVPFLTGGLTGYLAVSLSIDGEDRLTWWQRVLTSVDFTPLTGGLFVLITVLAIVNGRLFLRRPHYIC